MPVQGDVDGALVANAAKYLPAMAVQAIHDAGGQKRLTEILANDDDKFYDYHKALTLRAMPKQIETTTRTVDDVILDLDTQDYKAT